MSVPVGSLDVSKLPLGYNNAGAPAQEQRSSIWSKIPMVKYICEVSDSIARRRAAMGLKNPGTVENINKETSRDVFLNNYFFTGLRADLSKSFSMNPAFQISHSFSCGSPSMPSYGLTALYATDEVFLQGNVDNDMSLSGRMHYAWTKANTSKANLQIVEGQPAMLQMEHDYQGPDYSLNFKALNPSFLDDAFTGVAVASVLQSVTPCLALGLEAVYSRPSAVYPPDAAVSYLARYSAGDWMASAQLQAQGAILASFWRRVTDRVEAGIETSLSLAASQQAMMMGAGPTVEANTTIGAKYEFRQSVFRGQIESTGKVSCVLERRILPVVSVLFAGELDHFKGTSRLGLGLQFEAGGDEMMMQAEQATAQPPM